MAATADSPSDHLLRTLAAVPVSSTILDLACGRGRHTEPLLRLGFPVHACDPRPMAVAATRTRVAELIEGDPDVVVQRSSLAALGDLDVTFNWVVADRAEVYLSSPDELTRLFRRGRDLLAPGGWLYVTLPAAAEEPSGTPEEGIQIEEDRLEEAREAAGLAVVQERTRIDTDGTPRWRVLYRRVEPRSSAES